MTQEEALSWLHQVDGKLYQSNEHPSGTEAWVAVVRTPPSSAGNPQVIVALGGSKHEAAAAAETKWQALWGDLSRVH